MSYQVLARKWRPRRFAELVGQEHVVRALSNALDSGRTHHAYLFTGTRGVGKTTIARIFAKSLNCEQGTSAEPCGKCSVCEAVDSGRFVDLLEIDAASNTGVDNVRDVIENAQYAPTRGRYKVYLVDEVHMLSKGAFNALLKTLEEPPPHVKFLLATTDPEKLPATVLSRCLRFSLKRLLPEQISGQMRRILDAEGIEYEDEALVELARAADGSVRDGLSLLDQALAYAGGALSVAETRAMLGTVERSRLLALLEALASGDGKALMDECERIASFSPDFAGVLEELATLLHRVQLHQLVPGFHDDQADAEALASVSTAMGAEDVQLAYQLAIAGRRDLGLAPDARTGFEMTLLRMLAFQPLRGTAAGSAPSSAPAPAPATSRDAAAGGTQGAAPRSPTRPSAPPPAPRAAEPAAVRTPPVATAHTPASVAAPAPAPAPPVLDANGLPDWAALIKQAGLSGPIRELAVNATLRSLQDGKLTLALEPRHANLAVEPMTGQMQDKLAAVLGHPVKLHFVNAEAGMQTPAARQRAERDQRQADAERAIDEDPLVQSLVRDFGASVVPQSVRPNSTPTPEHNP
ncbi:MAG TPA: DNA polymerase III subunit gamma/tau [Oleiagrimonas sp.]|nr:DNA polymerase III subunit gamma/tau [Oleiagrimonas sp.]